MLSRVTSTFGVAICLSASASPVLAQQPEAASADCELHVWPTDQYAITDNFGDGQYGLVGALITEAAKLNSPGSVKAQVDSQVGPEIQERIMREFDIGTKFGLAGYRLVMESAKSQPTWTTEQLASQRRISNSAAPCYAEIAIISPQYLRQTVGTRLRTSIRYRRFSSLERPDFSLDATTAAKAPGFPAKRDDQIPASTASLQNAFRETLVKYVHDKIKR